MRNELIAVREVTENDRVLLEVLGTKVGTSAADAARFVTDNPTLDKVSFLRKTDLDYERVTVARRVKVKAAPKARKPKKQKAEAPPVELPLEPKE